jgi:hypothetical protein
MNDIYLTLDRTYSAIGSALCDASSVPEDKHADIAAKAKELLRLAEELQSLIEGEYA